MLSRVHRRFYRLPTRPNRPNWVHPRCRSETAPKVGGGIVEPQRGWQVIGAEADVREHGDILT